MLTTLPGCGDARKKMVAVAELSRFFLKFFAVAAAL
jgi:hypothetical protein